MNDIINKEKRQFVYDREKKPIIEKLKLGMVRHKLYRNHMIFSATDDGNIWMEVKRNERFRFSAIFHLLAPSESN